MPKTKIKLIRYHIGFDRIESILEEFNKFDLINKKKKKQQKITKY